MAIYLYLDFQFTSPPTIFRAKQITKSSLRE